MQIEIDVNPAAFEGQFRDQRFSRFLHYLLPVLERFFLLFYLGGEGSKWRRLSMVRAPG